MSATKRQRIPIARQQTFAAPAALAEPKLDALDAMLVGQTLRSLARNKRVGSSARECIERVGEQLWSAARLALAGGK